MDKNLQIPGLYTLRYQTAPVVPAPFSNFYSLDIHLISRDEVEVDFSITYTDREDMSEDEIIDEGFTKNDDFKWKGSIPALWIKEFDSIFSSSKIIRQREEEEYEDFIEIELEENGKRVTVYPVDKDRWNYFLQEFMQAIFEKAGREKAFELNYLSIDGADKTSIDLIASFASKEFSLVKNGEAAKPLKWSQLEKVMDTVYKAEFLEDNAAESKPTKNGTYISAGDGLWFQLGVAVVEPTSKSKELQKIEAIFKSLAS
ncbi:hypothetical protein DSL64_01035 [Dyadobacter luteus]|uniref:Uncharacterized protein n=1 Tax=Dyadobacter luteus TaxID=2259619 RepID=A0A3D8YI06_9BACT|nr:hypothetical protein [Dyadobacter luteus]REA64170.1 hypothetical protein DSL64_01035 [Dyadobacter luteus]